jgi:hypothetical protein
MASFGLRQAISLYLAMVVHLVLFVLPAWALLAAAGGRARRVSIGLVRVAGFPVAGVKVELGLLPITSFVDVVGMAPTDHDDEPGSWRTLSLLRRIAVLVAPWLLILVVAVLCLGPGRALTSAARAPSQLLLVLDTTPLIRGFFRVLAAEPFTVALGVLCAKSAPFNLLPFGSLAGGRVVQEIAGALRPAKAEGDAKPSAFWFVTQAILTLYVAGRLLWGAFHAFV